MFSSRSEKLAKHLPGKTLSCQRRADNSNKNIPPAILFFLNPRYKALFMETEHEYDVIYQALVGFRRSLSEVISSLDEHIRRAQLECLENSFQEQKNALAECVDGIDRELIKLSVYVGEYKRLHANLKELNEKRIPELGGPLLAMPEAIEGDTLSTILAQRINYLMAQGKL